MTHKYDKARRARASHAEKTKELSIAIKNSDRILARNFILKDKIKITGVTKQEFSRFFKVAVKSRDTPLVRALLDVKPKLDATVGAQLLWEVIHDADTRIAQMLVRAGADVNKSFNRHSISLLHVLAKTPDPRKYELGLLMMKYGANITARDMDDFTVLEDALIHENHAFAQELLKRGAVIDEDILWAIVDSRNPVKSLLLIVNGDHVKDAATRSQLVASTFKSLCSFDIAENQLIYMTKALFDLGIPDVVVIVQAVSHRRIGLMQSLFQRTDIDVRIKMMFLHCATTDPLSSRMAQALIEWGADIEYSVDLEQSYFNRGTRPLHVACRYEAEENIQLLLQLDADINATDDHGNTPFSYVIDNNRFSETCRLVVKHFALLTSKGVTVNEADLADIKFYSIIKQFYDRCLVELEEMKAAKLHKRISFYSILTKCPKKLVTLMRRQKFFDDYHDNLDCFPIYRKDLNLRFWEAQRLNNLLTPKEDALYQTLIGVLTIIPIEIIVHYMYLNDLETLPVGLLL